MSRNPCGQPDCRCTHAYDQTLGTGCDRGFINLVDECGRDVGVTPCRSCRPMLSDILDNYVDTDDKRRRIDEMRDMQHVRRVASRR